METDTSKTDARGETREQDAVFDELGVRTCCACSDSSTENDQ